eukprot:4129147-Ditylum_brightwellii.AAC.1
MEQQRLRQVRFVKDAERQAKKRGLTGRDVKDLNAFVKDKIKETIKECDRNMHEMSNFDNLSISSSNGSMESIISNTSNEELDSDSRKPAHKK